MPWYWGIGGWMYGLCFEPFHYCSVQYRLTLDKRGIPRKIRFLGISFLEVLRNLILGNLAPGKVFSIKWISPFTTEIFEIKYAVLLYHPFFKSAEHKYCKLLQNLPPYYPTPMAHYHCILYTKSNQHHCSFIT